MQVSVYDTKQEMARAAAACGVEALQRALAARGEASVVLATGASQFEMLSALVEAPDVDWHRVTFFHLDEYIGLPLAHPASFRLYLWQRFVSRLPVPPRVFHYLDGEGDGEAECRRAGALIARHPIDVAFVGIGENAHLAFNDPPADFATDEPFLLVELDEACRRQQLGEGWFATLEDVPKQAISMSIAQIMSSARIVCTVPDERKAGAVKAALEGEVTEDVPASILRQHDDCALFLDRPAASLLSQPFA